MCILDERTDGKVFNIGSGVNYSVHEILEKVSKILGVPADPVYKDDLPGEAEITLADITRAKALGWTPKTPLEVGLRKAIEYIRQEVKAGGIP
jgi:nucleoside-diphosphate-sugar epimerase